MSAVDDILYAPIIPSGDANIDSAVIAQFALALSDPNVSVSWVVDQSVSIATYNRIAQIVETDRVIFKVTRQFCASDPWGNFRPQKAMNIKMMFEDFHSHQSASTPYFWVAKGTTQGVIAIDVCNQFSIVNGIPTVRLTDGHDYQWWHVGLLSNFAGYQGYYLFQQEADAEEYWNTP